MWKLFLLSVAIQAVPLFGFAESKEFQGDGVGIAEAWYDYGRIRFSIEGKSDDDREATVERLDTFIRDHLKAQPAGVYLVKHYPLSGQKKGPEITSSVPEDQNLVVIESQSERVLAILFDAIKASPEFSAVKFTAGWVLEPESDANLKKTSHERAVRAAAKEATGKALAWGAAAVYLTRTKDLPLLNLPSEPDSKNPFEIRKKASATTKTHVTVSAFK